VLGDPPQLATIPGATVVKAHANARMPVLCFSRIQNLVYHPSNGCQELEKSCKSIDIYIDALVLNPYIID
jgi:hypothetical protein